MVRQDRTPDQDFLVTHGGMPAPDPTTAARARRRQSATLTEAMEELTQASFTTAELEATLSGDVSETHQQPGGGLYSFEWRGQTHYPMWQFTHHPAGYEPLPHLATVIAALPETLHPLDVTDFFTKTRLPNHEGVDMPVCVVWPPAALSNRFSTWPAASRSAVNRPDVAPRGKPGTGPQHGLWAPQLPSTPSCTTHRVNRTNEPIA